MHSRERTSAPLVASLREHRLSVGRQTPGTKKGRAPCGTRPFVDIPRYAGNVTTGYATAFTLSAATAMRFDSGCAASPASFITCSVVFEASATYASNALRM